MAVDKIFTNLKGRSFLICTMNKSDKRLSKSVTITNDLGLHVWIIKDEEKVDAASIIDILTLACAKGSKITLKIDDQSDLYILNNIAKLIESGFGE